MCGIVGYLGKGEAYPALIKGLKRLEYRGYDSAGVALISNDGALNVYKAKGKVADLEAFCSDKDISGHVGIAHTRSEERRVGKECRSTTEIYTLSLHDALPISRIIPLARTLP